MDAGKIIGENLIAKESLYKYEFINGALTKTGTFSPGDVIGIVYSYITKDPFTKKTLNLMWMIKPDEISNPFYVYHKQGRFEITQKIKNQIIKDELELEQTKKDTEGAIPFYIEKYGTKLFLGIAAVVIISSLIKKQWK